MADLKYPRALVKVSGESLAGERGFGIEPAVVKTLTEEVGAVHGALQTGSLTTTKLRAAGSDR